MMVGNGFNPFTFNINEEFILGCTSENACNYNSFVNFIMVVVCMLNNFLIVMDYV